MCNWKQINFWQHTWASSFKNSYNLNIDDILLYMLSKHNDDLWVNGRHQLKNMTSENKVLRHVEFNSKHVSITVLQISIYTYKGNQRENLQGMYPEVVHWIFNMNNTMLLYSLN